jgi:chromate transporter
VTRAAEDVTGDIVPFRSAIRAWFRVSLQTFGGPAGQIAVMHRELVDERRWFGERRFLHALNYCMLLPGPEAQQLAIYLGWLLNGTAGGLVAGVLFVLPGFVAILALSTIYVVFGDTTAVSAIFAGVAPAVLAIVASALWRVAGRALSNGILVGLAVAAFIALFAFGAPFPAVIAAAAAIGFVGGRRWPDRSGHRNTAARTRTLRRRSSPMTRCTAPNRRGVAPSASSRSVRSHGERRCFSSRC